MKQPPQRPQHPYRVQPPKAFWTTGVCGPQDDASLALLYDKRFEIKADTKIATAGSCFAQHIHRTLQAEGDWILDVEPPPPGLPTDLHRRYGYSMFSGRYGNIYTARQLRQLVEEAEGRWQPVDICWEREGRWVDALRPTLEPKGHDSPNHVLIHRDHHITQMRLLLQELDVFVFTLGLTEGWQHLPSGTVYPLAPGTQGGRFDSSLHRLHNSSHAETLADLEQMMQSLERIRLGRPYQLLLTVSPVPLTATASQDHVLTATSRSKATLRSVAAELCDRHQHVAYFPSYELIHHPARAEPAFSDNLRTIQDAAVNQVMRVFLQAHGLRNQLGRQHDTLEDDLICDEALLDQFAP